MPVLLALAGAGAWLLLGAGYLKVREPEGTSQAISVLTGTGQVKAGARVLGILESGVALGFLLWPTLPTALVLGAAYLLVFGSAWLLRGRDEDCGCFGASSSQVGTPHLIITLAAAAAALSYGIFASTAVDPRGYLLIAASSTVALGAFAVMAPLNQLRTGLADLRS